MKSTDRIPTSKLQRTSKLVGTGVRLGANYLKYYGQRLVDDERTAKERLNENNAADIYDSLKDLKGSALKVAQMLSMERNMLPQAYVERFSLSQFSVPPLSAPLVRKTLKRYLQEDPEHIFDSFDYQAMNAASIGQVHRASSDGRALAVKIQYPGIAESIQSDLALVKPIALRMFNLGTKESEKYFKEVEAKLLEETNYVIELKQSKEITQACAHIEGVSFPEYVESLSSERVLTMTYVKGKPLGEWVKTAFEQEVGDKIGQALWDFYMFQIHGLRKVHADPHPGNFLIGESHELIVIDFGCIKELPEDFYVPYFELADQATQSDESLFIDKLYALEMLVPSDGPKEVAYFTKLYKDLLQLFTSPFNRESFDFGDPTFWEGIGKMAAFFANDEQLRTMNANRGSKHFLYMNRTFFGLYNLLYDLKAKVDTRAYQRYMID